MIDFFIKLGLYVALGMLLVIANIWYFKSLAVTFFTAQPQKSIAPFDVVGKEDPNGNLGSMLARQLQGKLVEIADTMAATKQKLETQPDNTPPLPGSDKVRQERGAPRLPGQYRTLLNEVAVLHEKAPDWKPLLRLSATLAEMTGAARQAHALYRRELELTDAREADHGWISAKLAALEATIEPVGEIELPRLAAGISLHEDKNVMKTLRETEAARRLLTLIGGGVPVAQKETRVAVLGGLPWGQEGAATGQASYLADYVESLAQVVKLVTPSARLLFEPLAADSTAASGFKITDSEIIPHLEKLIAAKPEVLLIAIGPLLSPKYAPLLERAVAQDTLVVLAAGNLTEQSSQQFVQPQLVEDAMIVSAVTPVGLPAPYSPTGTYLYWAPGEQIPVYNPDRQALEQRAGTGYAAAVAAGVVSRVISENPNLSMINVLSILRMTAVQLEADTGASVLHLQNAVAKARSWEVMSVELFEENDHVDLMIPDGEPQGISRTIRVDKQGRLLDVLVKVDITHTYIGDLRVWLTSPQGQLFVLHDRQGGSKDNLVKEYGLAVAPGLTELIGADISGDWALSVADLTRMDVGHLKSWGLKLRYEPIGR
jgi:subtilisin-like proprotein convertase family protein